MLSRRLKYGGPALILLLALVIIAAACGGDADTPVPTSTKEPTSDPTATAAVVPTPTEQTVEAAVVPTDEPEEKPDEAARRVGGEVGNLAPELVGITGWLNAEPFTLESLRGNVVLIDVWTYTCVNCIRTLPYIKEWHDKYADKGLVIVGVHSPEFEFEKVRENVEGAIEDYELKYPVVQDNDFRTWRALSNRYWPAKYLVDKDGVIRYRHFGEGAYDETEQQIRDLLDEAGFQLTGTSPGLDPGPTFDDEALSSVTGQTRELYAGSDRNSGISSNIWGAEYYETPVGSTVEYMDSGETYRNHYLYLHGSWTKTSESLVHGRKTMSMEDYIGLRFNGTSANVVLDFDGGDPYKVAVTLEDEPLPETHRGMDIQVDSDGTTFLVVDGPRMYNMVKLPEYGGGNLKLSSDSDRFSVYAFTFGSYFDVP